ncbi:MAG: TIM barrel protein [Phycisphaerales bacterium]
MPLQDLRPQALRRDPEALLRHLRDFRLPMRFSAGIWYFSPAASRFHDRYQPVVDVRARLEIAARVAETSGDAGATARTDGLVALEAHYPNEINRENLDVWLAFTRDTGVRVLTVIPLLFWDGDFEFGSLSSPLKAPRALALRRTIEALELNRELATDFAVVWPGIDGVENPFGADVVAMRDRFAAGLAEAMDAVPGVRIAFEPKPYEPRGRILFGTTAEGMLLAPMVESRLRHPANRALLGQGHGLLCLNPEVGHVLMGYEDLAMAFAWPLGEARLAHSHWNSQPLGNYDQDLPVGTISPEALEALVYLLRLHGYAGHLGIDINPERMPVEVALRISMDAIRAANDRVESLDHEAILFANDHPDRARGWLEGYLVRARAARPERLGPWARPI